MRPLTPEEDTARGMLTGVVADEESLKEKFKIRQRSGSTAEGLTVAPSKESMVVCV